MPSSSWDRYARMDRWNSRSSSTTRMITTRIPIMTLRATTIPTTTRKIPRFSSAFLVPRRANQRRWASSHRKGSHTASLGAPRLLMQARLAPLGGFGRTMKTIPRTRTALRRASLAVRCRSLAMMHRTPRLIRRRSLALRARVRVRRAPCVGTEAANLPRMRRPAPPIVLTVATTSAAMARRGRAARPIAGTAVTEYAMAAKRRRAARRIVAPASSIAAGPAAMEFAAPMR